MQEVFEKIIERLRQSSYNHAFCGTDMAIDEETAVQIVEDICEEYNGGWISIEKNLPTAGEIVHVTVKRGYIEVGYWDEFREEWWKVDDEGLLDVIAWHPAPEEYQPKEG